RGCAVGVAREPRPVGQTAHRYGRRGEPTGGDGEGAGGAGREGRGVRHVGEARRLAHRQGEVQGGVLPDAVGGPKAQRVVVAGAGERRAAQRGRAVVVVHEHQAGGQATGQGQARLGEAACAEGEGAEHTDREGGGEGRVEEGGGLVHPQGEGLGG